MTAGKWRHTRLKVIPEPKQGTRTVFITDNTDPDFVYVQGDSPAGRSFECGRCGRPLIVGVERNQVRNVVLRCPQCGSYNDMS